MDNDVYWLKRAVAELAQRSATRPAPPVVERRDWASLLASAERSCCCPAKPAVIAVLAWGEPPEPTDLLLCGHHHRISRHALAVAHAVVYNADGTIYDAPNHVARASRLERPRRESSGPYGPPPGRRD